MESTHAALASCLRAKSPPGRSFPPPGPDPRFLQTAVFDETRKVLVMFADRELSQRMTFITEPLPASQYLWSGSRDRHLDNRNPSGPCRASRARARHKHGLDSARNKFVIFGGRSQTSETPTATTRHLEWSREAAISPTARARVRHRTPAASTAWCSRSPPQGAALRRRPRRNWNQRQRRCDQCSAFGDTWEWDPATGKWSKLTPVAAPSARYDSAWSGQQAQPRRLFVGWKFHQPVWLASPSRTSGSGIRPSWPPGWTDRTTMGASRTRALATAWRTTPPRIDCAGGRYDIATGNGLADLWEWDPTTAVWTQRLTGSEPTCQPCAYTPH